MPSNMIKLSGKIKGLEIKKIAREFFSLEKKIFGISVLKIKFEKISEEVRN
jgi:hypothetical protein